MALILRYPFLFLKEKRRLQIYADNSANLHIKCVKNCQIYSSLLYFPFFLLFGVGIAQTIVQFIESGLTGLEPATSVLTGRYSNQLNYNPTRYSLLTNKVIVKKTVPDHILFCKTFLFQICIYKVSVRSDILYIQYRIIGD